MAKKQTFVVGSTNPNTNVLTDSRLNNGWDRLEVLHSGDLDGFFNAVSAQSQINSEEITNALDVYSITPDPTDNTQLKQVLVQMDNKINQISTGGVIVGSFWFGKTTPNFTVPAPTAVGQTYLDFTNLKTYVSNNGSTWTQNGTLVLSQGQDSIVLITSKFWDIVEQQDQFGGRATWALDLQQWIYSPTIISIDLSNYVNTTSAQTVSGVKTFSASPIVPTPTTSTQATNKDYVDSGVSTLSGACVKLSGNQTIADVKTFTSSPVIPTPTTSTEAANKSYVDSVSNTAVKLTGDQTISGTKTFSSVSYGQTSDANNSLLTTVSKSKSQNGYFKLGNGLIVQWGRFSVTSYNADGTVNLPTAFSNTNYSVTAAGARFAGQGQGELSLLELKTTAFRWRSSAGSNLFNDMQFWIAIGY